jgi:serine protease Do
VLLRCGVSIGSGFVVGPETVLTNAHVLCRSGAAPSVVTPDGTTYTGAVVSTDPAIDLAALRVAGLTAPPLVLADATALARGDRVMIAGNPMGLEFAVNEGFGPTSEQIAALATSRPTRASILATAAGPSSTTRAAWSVSSR